MNGGWLSASALFTRMNLQCLTRSPRSLRVHTSAEASSGCALKCPLPLGLLTLSRDAGCKRVRMLSVSASTRSDDSTCTTTPAQSLRPDSVDPAAACKNRLCVRMRQRTCSRRSRTRPGSSNIASYHVWTSSVSDTSSRVVVACREAYVGYHSLTSRKFCWQSTTVPSNKLARTQLTASSSAKSQLLLVVCHLLVRELGVDVGLPRDDHVAQILHHLRHLGGRDAHLPTYTQPQPSLPG